MKTFKKLGDSRYQLANGTIICKSGVGRISRDRTKCITDTVWVRENEPVGHSFLTLKEAIQFWS